MVQTVSAPIRKVYSEQLANANCPANTADNTTRRPIAVRRGFSEILIEPAAAGRLHLVPAIREAYFYDASRTLGDRWIDLLRDKDKALINRHVAGDTETYLNSMTASDFLYIGTVRPAKGYFMDMDASLVNAVVATLAAEYSRLGGFATTAITDGTASGGAPLATDGNVGIDTVPTDWGAFELKQLLPISDVPKRKERLFWSRLSVSATLTAGVEIEEIVPLAAVGAGTITTASDSIIVKASTEYSIPIPINIPEWVGALEFIAQGAAATTANLTWIAR